MRSYDTRRGGIFSILEILIVVAIIAFLFIKFGKLYLGSPVTDKGVNEQLQQQGIDTSTSKAMIDSTRSKLDDINKQAVQRQGGVRK